jgi:4-amino-4-deoxy-L-arabinose transferase-like glycosyltransferase
VAIALVGVWCLALFYYGLGTGDLYRTEGLRAIIAAEFLHSGNWLVPYLYQTPLLTKPPGMYAAIALCSWPQGQVTEVTARLPSAVMATAFVYLLFWYVRRHLGTWPALAITLMTPCGFLWLDKAPSAEIDMVQTAWVGMSILFLLRAVEAEEEQTPALPWWFLALACVAGGVLTKWTGAMFFYGMAFPFLLWRRRFRLLWSWRHLLPAFLFGGLCLAWLVAAFVQIGWDTAWFQLSVEAGPRLMHNSTHSRQATPSLIQDTLLHPFKIWAVNLPFALFALTTLHPAFLRCWDAQGRRFLQGLHCWAWPNLLLMTLLPDHATRHSFPLFPAITALAGMAWVAFLTGRMPEALAQWHRRMSLLMLGGLLIAAFGAAGWGFMKLSQEQVFFVSLLGLLTLWCVWEGFSAWRQERSLRLFSVVLLTWLLAKLAFVELGVPYRQDHRGVKATGTQMASLVPPGQTLYLRTVKDECVMFYYGRPVKRLDNWNELPTPGPVYCLLEDAPNKPEWREFQAEGTWHTLWHTTLRDGQGSGMILVAVERR